MTYEQFYQFVRFGCCVWATVDGIRVIKEHDFNELQVDWENERFYVDKEWYYFSELGCNWDLTVDGLRQGDHA